MGPYSIAKDWRLHTQCRLISLCRRTGSVTPSHVTPSHETQFGFDRQDVRMYNLVIECMNWSFKLQLSLHVPWMPSGRTGSPCLTPQLLVGMQRASWSTASITWQWGSMGSPPLHNFLFKTQMWIFGLSFYPVPDLKLKKPFWYH